MTLKLFKKKTTKSKMKFKFIMVTNIVLGYVVCIPVSSFGCLAVDIVTAPVPSKLKAAKQ